MNLFPLRYVHDSEYCTGNLLPDVLFLTEDSKLLIVGHCALCGSHIQISVPVEYLLTHMPCTEQHPAHVTLLNPQELNEDAEFLRSLGIDPQPPSGGL